MNDLSTYFGVNTAVVTPFAYENALNTLITNLDLFDVQYHTENSILLTDLIDQFVQVAGETSPYAQSDWNAFLNVRNGQTNFFPDETRRQY